VAKKIKAASSQFVAEKILIMKVSDYIVFENDDFVAVNKPSGLLSIPDREGKEVSLKVLLKEKYGNIFTVHRLDRDTSGLVVFAKNEATHKHLSQQFEGRLTKKIYQGLVIGSLPEKKGTIDSPIAEHPGQNGTMIVHRKGKESLTDYEVLDDFGIYSFVQFQIHTGRTHQIRVHLSSIGKPVFGDPTYGGRQVRYGSDTPKIKIIVQDLLKIIPRQALHAKTLGFFHPVKKEKMNFDSHLPSDMIELISTLRTSS